MIIVVAQMGVVELDCGLLWQGKDAAIAAHMAVHEILNRRRLEKILLPQAQLAPRRRVVARVKNLRDRLGVSLLGQRRE